MSSAGKDKDFQLTSEEVDRLKDALKKEEFRKLLVDYAKEISDPENRKRYEEEIAQLERNRGQDVKFLHPKPGFVVKARLIDSKKKIFVNICMNDLIKPPVASPMQTSGKIGHNWSIPYSLSPGREDVDKGGVKCTVYDVVFNPQNFKECDKDPRFRQLMISTALEGLEKQLSIKVDKKALKYPKLEYKGTPSSSVIRRPHPDGPVPPEEQPHLKFPYPSDPKKSSSSDKKAKVKKSKQKHEPVHTVTHRGEVDMGDYTNSRVSSAVKRPKSLVVRVELPGVKSVANVDLEVFERKLELTVDNPKYVLKLPLHYDVDQDNTTAQFDKSKEVLTVTIPVLPSSTPLPSDGDLVSHPSDPTSTEGDFPSPTEGDVPTPTEGDFPSPTVLSASSPPTSAAEVGLQDLTDRDQAQNPSRTRGDGEGMKQFGDKDELETPSTQSTSLPLLPSVLWVCPPYRFRQTQDSIVFVFDVKNVVQGSVVTHFDQHWSHMTFTTFTDGQSYSFYVSSDEGLALNCDKSSVDVTTENIVMVLNKDENCHHLWSSVWVGTSSEDKKKLLFFTRPNSEDSSLAPEDGVDVWSTGSPLTHKTLVSKLDEDDGSLTVDVECVPSTDLCAAATGIQQDRGSKVESAHVDTPGNKETRPDQTEPESVENKSNDPTSSNCPPKPPVIPSPSDNVSSPPVEVEQQSDVSEQTLTKQESSNNVQREATVEQEESSVVQQNIVVEQESNAVEQHGNIVKQESNGIEQHDSDIVQESTVVKQQYDSLSKQGRGASEQASKEDIQAVAKEEPTSEQGKPLSPPLSLSNKYIYDLD